MEPVIYRRLGQGAIFIGPTANSTSAGNSLFIFPSAAAGSAPPRWEFCPGKGAQQALGAAEPRPSRCSCTAGTTKSIENGVRSYSLLPVHVVPAVRTEIIPLGSGWMSARRRWDCLQDDALHLFIKSGGPRCCGFTQRSISWRSAKTQAQCRERLRLSLRSGQSDATDSVVPRRISLQRPVRQDGRFESQLYPSGSKT